MTQDLEDKYKNDYEKVLKIEPYEKLGTSYEETKENLLRSLLSFIYDFSYLIGVNLLEEDIMKANINKILELKEKIKDIKYTIKQKELLDNAKTIVFRNLANKIERSLVELKKDPKRYFKILLDVLYRECKKVRDVIASLKSQSKTDPEFVKIYFSLWDIFDKIIKKKKRLSH